MSEQYPLLRFQMSCYDQYRLFLFLLFLIKSYMDTIHVTISTSILLQLLLCPHKSPSQIHNSLCSFLCLSICFGFCSLRPISVACMYTRIRLNIGGEGNSSGGSFLEKNDWFVRPQKLTTACNCLTKGGICESLPTNAELLAGVVCAGSCSYWELMGATSLSFRQAPIFSSSPRWMVSPLSTMLSILEADFVASAQRNGNHCVWSNSKMAQGFLISIVNSFRIKSIFLSDEIPPLLLLSMVKMKEICRYE